MEVMQYLKEEVDKKKEQVHHLKDEVEEKIEELLVGRCGYERLHDAANNGTTITVDESITQSSVAGTGHPDAKMKQPAVVEVDHNHDKSQKSVFLDESADASQEGSHVEKIPNGEAVAAKLKDVDIQKVLSAVINGQNMEILEQTFSSRSTLPPSTKPQEEDGNTSVGRIKNETERLKIDVVDDSDEEVLELEFERAVEKMHTHEYNMYCPNCSSRITKVILRRRKREKRTQPQDLLGCLACFSIFIPKGNLLNPFNIFGGRKDRESSQIRQEQQPLLAPDSTAQQQHPSGGSVGDIGRGRGPFSTPGKSTENGNSSNSQQSSLPDGASQPAKTNNIASVGSSTNPNVDGRVPDGKPGTSYGVYPAISNGTVIIDIPDKLGGTTQETKHPQKPISEIVDGQNETNDQYLGGGDQFPPEERPVPTETSQSTVIQTATERPLIPKESTGSKPLEILKSIVYGGLTESITSLSIVSSAAASEATTLNIVALGLANLIGGLFVLFHNLKDLRYEETNEANEEVKSRYQELLGRKENFLLHTIFAVLSYLVFGLIPPVVYGFTFHETDDRDFKMVAVAASALACIVVLAIAKAYTRGQQTFMAYSKTVVYYVIGAVMVSGIAYAVGHLFERLMVTLGWFDSNPVQHLLVSENKPWASF